ncbi:MAG: tyrosine-type recombinase/integrase [Solirubrobacteraceae bacterium]
MSAVRRASEEYLQMRRALGYKLEIQGWLLGGFVPYLEQIGAETVTIEHALRWATQPAGADPAYWSNRLSAVRQFARYLQTFDPRCEVPAPRLLPYRPRRATPYPYQPEQIVALMRAAGRLPRPLQAASYQTLIGLLAVSGLRVGEAIRLNRDDVDARDQLVRIINTKFGKSREVALHLSAMNALSAYGQLRDQLSPRPRCEAFFVSTAGTRLHAANINRTFIGLVRAVGLKPRSTRCRPRVHDLRHGLAVNTLLDWYRAGIDVHRGCRGSRHTWGHRTLVDVLVPDRRA